MDGVGLERVCFGGRETGRCAWKGGGKGELAAGGIKEVVCALEWKSLRGAGRIAIRG